MNNNPWQIGASAGILGLFALLSAALSYIVSGQLGWSTVVLIVIGVVLLGLFVWTSPAETRSTTGGRYLRYGGNTVLMLLAFVGILIGINFLASRHITRWDLTANKQFTLSPQTIKILQNLKDPVNVTAFYKDEDPSSQTAKDLFKQYAAYTDKIKVDYVDPDRKLAVAQQFQIQYAPTLVFQSGDKRQDVSYPTESDVTAAILKLRAAPKTVYFLTGHGEANPEETGNNGYSQVRLALQQNAYTVETLNLTTNPTLTVDMGILVIAGPKVDLVDKEEEAIKDFVGQGGKLMILQDPGSKAALDDLLGKWSIQFGSGIAIDPAAGAFGDPGAVVIQKYGASPVTKDLLSTQTLFPYARSVIVPKDPTQGAAILRLAETTDRSWLETDDKVLNYDEGKDTKGPLTLAVTIEEPVTGQTATSGKQPKTRVVAIGNSIFAANAVLTQYGTLGNRDFVVNAINWLGESEDYIAVGPKVAEDRSLVFTGNQSNTIFFTSAVFVPALVLLAGVSVWWRRR